MIHIKVDDMEGPEQCTFEKAGVIVADFAKLVTVKDTAISESGCSYIFSDRTPVSVHNSEFSLGQDKNPYISMRGGELTVEGSRFKPAAIRDSTVRGRGIYCDYCTELKVFGSSFEGLVGFQGGAVFLKDSVNGLMTGNLFEDNLAMQGGAVYI